MVVVMCMHIHSSGVSVCFKVGFFHALVGVQAVLGKLALLKLLQEQQIVQEKREGLAERECECASDILPSLS